MAKALLVSLAVDRLSYPAYGRFRLGRLQRRPLLGMLYFCAAVEACGVECEIADQAVEGFSLDGLRERVKTGGYLFVGFYVQLLIKEKVAEYARVLAESVPGVKLVAGGPGHLLDKELLESGCGLVCKGEGEQAAADIVAWSRGEKQPKDIAGIAYLEKGELVRTSARGHADGLDRLPLPAWHRLDLKRYYDRTMPTLRHPFAPMITSRGCPFSCTFCSSPRLWGHTYRTRSVAGVLNEIDLLTGRYGVRYIIFQDDVFGLDNGWLREFCMTLVARHPKLRWMCLLHPLTLAQRGRELLPLMARAGCDLIGFGLQSADPAVLKAIGRDQGEPAALSALLKTARSCGIITSVDFILGLPGETPFTPLINSVFAETAGPDLVNFHPLRVEPGSALAESGKTPASPFSGKALVAECAKANRRFYLRPPALLRILHILSRTRP